MPLSMSAAMGDVWTYDASSTTSSLLQIVVDIVVVVVAALSRFEHMNFSTSCKCRLI